jgi:hypothetical protein
MVEEDGIQERLAEVEKDVAEWIKKIEDDPSMIMVLLAVDSLDIALRLTPDTRTKVARVLMLMADYVDPDKNSEVENLDNLLNELKQDALTQNSVDISMMFQTFAQSAQPGTSRGPIRRLKLGSFETN